MEDIEEESTCLGDLDESMTDLTSGYDPLLTTVPPPEVPPNAQDVSQYKFSRFAATYFREGVTSGHIRAVIDAPLLPLRKDDRQAAVAVWITLLRFLGDVPDKDGDLLPDNMNTTPVMKKIYATLGRNSKFPNVEEDPGGDQPIPKTAKKKNTKPGRFSQQKKFISGALKGKTKHSEDFSFAMLSGDQKGVNELLGDRPTNNLEKIHFIIGNAILRPDLRDEIYCQICKQLTLNPDKSSHARGWILLSLCAGCFVPSDRFLPYLRCFLNEGPPRYAPYCTQRLQRTMDTGNRTEPSSWLELQGSKSKRLYPLLVTLMNGQTKTLLSDSSTTAAEFCREISRKIGLQDHFGFSLFITAFDKVSSVGNGSEHVMDVISKYEQIAKEHGYSEREAPWRLFFRKEYFSPWHDPGFDSIATNLIYHQVVRGVKFGEYRIDNVDDIARLAAQQYYVENDLDMVESRLSALLPSYIPDELLQGSGSLEKWTQMVIHEHCFLNCASPVRVKEDIVEYAMYKWPKQFSRFFEAYRYAGPMLSGAKVSIVVNYTGVFVVDDSDHVLLELDYSEITSVSCSRTTKTHGRCFTLATVRDEEYVFTSTIAKDICDLVTTFIDGLKTNIKHVYVPQDRNAQSHVENTQEKYVPVGGMALRYKVHDFIRYFTESVELLEDIPHMLLSAQSLV